MQGLGGTLFSMSFPLLHIKDRGNQAPEHSKPRKDKKQEELSAALPCAGLPVCALGAGQGLWPL